MSERLTLQNVLVVCGKYHPLPAESPKVEVVEILSLAHPAYDKRTWKRTYCLKAILDLEEGEYIGYYAGKVVFKGSWNPYWSTPYEDCSYVVDAAKIQNKTAFINDNEGIQDEPNAAYFETEREFGGCRTVVIKTLRPVKAGEEITCCYGEWYWNNFRKWENKKRSLSCEQCNTKFWSGEAWLDHVNRHDEIRPYQCPYCDQTFYSALGLAGHAKSH